MEVKLKSEPRVHKVDRIDRQAETRGALTAHIAARPSALKGSWSIARR
jgi:hypothetical protein